MRILMISDTYFPRISGVATSIRSFRQGLELVGHQVDLLIPDYDISAIDTPGIMRIPSHKTRLYPEERLMYPRALLSIKSELAGRNYDLLHIQTPFVAHYLGNHIARALKIPVISSYHTYFEAYLGYYYSAIPALIRKSLVRIPSKKQCAAVDGLVVPSRAMAEVLWSYGVSTPVRVIPTGIPMNQEDFSGSQSNFRHRHGIPKDRPILLYAGRIAPEKNISLLLSMMPHLLVRHPDSMLLLAGDGPARASLEKQARDKQLTEQVRFLGYLDHNKELPDAYAAADLLVFASETETQGMVLLEALAASLPVVAVPAMGAADIMDSSLGTRSTPAEARIFAQICADILDDKTLHQKLKSEARQHAQQWAESTMVQELAKFYEQTITKAKLDRRKIRNHENLSKS